MYVNSRYVLQGEDSSAFLVPVYTKLLRLSFVVFCPYVHRRGSVGIGSTCGLPERKYNASLAPRPLERASKLACGVALRVWRSKLPATSLPIPIHRVHLLLCSSSSASSPRSRRPAAWGQSAFLRPIWPQP